MTAAFTLAFFLGYTLAIVVLDRLAQRRHSAAIAKFADVLGSLWFAVLVIVCAVVAMSL